MLPPAENVARAGNDRGPNCMIAINPLAQRQSVFNDSGPCQGIAHIIAIESCSDYRILKRHLSALKLGHFHFLHSG